MKKFFRFLDKFEEYSLAILMGIMAVVVFLQVIFRVIGGSLTWSEETSRYLTVWITFIGASLGVRRGAHIGVEAFTMLIPAKPRKVVIMLGQLLCIFFCGVVCFYSIGIIQNQILYGQISPAMRIPMWWPYAAIPVGSALMIIRYLESIGHTIRTFNDPIEQGAVTSEIMAKEEGGSK
ncbi:MAG: TRAP transporter small permease [Peptococcaceae bacterium]|nr:TRAP transporter small permease [Peptococcaceae bacterium]